MAKSMDWAEEMVRAHSACSRTRPTSPAWGPRRRSSASHALAVRRRLPPHCWLQASSGAGFATQHRYSYALYNLLNQAALQFDRGDQDQLQLLSAVSEGDNLPGVDGLTANHGWRARREATPVAPLLVLSLPLTLEQTKRAMKFLHTDPDTNEKVDDKDALSPSSVRTYSNAWRFLHTRHGTERTPTVMLFMSATKEGARKGPRNATLTALSLPPSLPPSRQARRLPPFLHCRDHSAWLLRRGAPHLGAARAPGVCCVGTGAAGLWSYLHLRRRRCGVSTPPAIVVPRLQSCHGHRRCIAGHAGLLSAPQ